MVGKKALRGARLFLLRFDLRNTATEDIRGSVRNPACDAKPFGALDVDLLPHSLEIAHEPAIGAEDSVVEQPLVACRWQLCSVRGAALLLHRLLRQRSGHEQHHEAEEGADCHGAT